MALGECAFSSVFVRRERVIVGRLLVNEPVLTSQTQSIVRAKTSSSISEFQTASVF